MKCTHLHPGLPTHASSDTVPRERNTVWSGLSTQERYVAWTAAVSGATGSVQQTHLEEVGPPCGQNKEGNGGLPRDLQWWGRTTRKEEKQQSSLKLHQKQILTKQLQREQPNRSTTISLMTYTFLYNIPSVV